MRAYFGIGHGWSKTAIPLAGVLAMMVLAGCGATSELAVHPPVGPDSTAPLDLEPLGVLQVYSAKLPADTDVNFQEFFANDDFGGNRFPLEPAHSDYTISTRAGQVLARVHNARGLNGAQPTLVTIPAGAYKIEAQAKDTNPGTFPVVVPIIIQAGRTTRVYLDGE